MESYHKMISKLYKYIFYFLAFLGVLMLAIGTAQVVSRYVLHNSLTWSEETMRFLNVWTIYIGVSVGIPLGIHVSIDAIPNMLKGKTKNILSLIILILSLIFYLIFLVQGVRFSLANLNQYAPATMVPMGYVYLCLPLGGLLAALFTVDEILKLSKRMGEDKCQQ